ncbi:MAG TPA: hypothetical protein DD454_03730 [Candidatus Moranbacteria bacterium]|nr:hypothetical protein [Candidatus Moranbacteria bacterium]
METEASVIMNGGRIAQIDVFPSGKLMEEVFYCECITHDFLGHGKPADYWLENGRLVFSCDSGVFSFEISCCEKDLEKIGKQISNRGFTFAKKGDGFSLIA